MILDILKNLKEFNKEQIIDILYKYDIRHRWLGECYEVYSDIKINYVVKVWRDDVENVKDFHQSWIFKQHKQKNKLSKNHILKSVYLEPFMYLFHGALIGQMEVRGVGHPMNVKRLEKYLKKKIGSESLARYDIHNHNIGYLNNKIKIIDL